MIAKKGYKVKFAKIKLDWEGLRVTFNPVAIQGLERYFHGFFNDNYQVNYFMSIILYNILN